MQLLVDSATSRYCEFLALHDLNFLYHSKFQKVRKGALVFNYLRQNLSILLVYFKELVYNMKIEVWINFIKWFAKLKTG